MNEWINKGGIYIEWNIIQLLKRDYDIQYNMDEP
jgi:hypothetical protein